MSAKKAVRSFVLVLGDPLDPSSAVFDDFDAKRDIVWLAEVAAESEHIWTSKPEDARATFRDFIEHCLARFGQFQDAKWGKVWAEVKFCSDACRMRKLGGAHG